MTRDDLARPGTVVQLGLPPGRIDLLTGITGVPEFAGAWAGRREEPIRGRAVPFIGRADLVANKRATGRPKDLGDLDQLGE